MQPAVEASGALAESPPLVARLVMRFKVPFVGPWVRRTYEDRYSSRVRLLRDAFERCDELAPNRGEIRPAVLAAIDKSQAWHALAHLIDAAVPWIAMAVLFGSAIVLVPFLWFHFNRGHAHGWPADLVVAAPVAALYVFVDLLVLLPHKTIVTRLITLTVASTVLTLVWLQPVWPLFAKVPFLDYFIKGFALSLGVYFGLMVVVQVIDSVADTVTDWIRCRYHRNDEVIGSLCLMLVNLGELGNGGELTLASTIGWLTHNFRLSISGATAVPSDALDFELQGWCKEKIRRRVTFLRRLKRDAMLAPSDDNAAASLLLAICRTLPLAARGNWLGFPEAADDVDDVGAWEKWQPRVRAALAFVVVCALWATVQFAPLPALDSVRPQAAFGLLTVIVLMLFYWIDPTHHDTIRSGLSTGMGLFKGPKP